MDVADLRSSILFDPETGFGGDGVPSNKHCIADGPFKDVTLRYKPDTSEAEYCITRNLNPCLFTGAAQRVIDGCLKKTTFVQLWHCIEGMPHSAGHGGVGGIVRRAQNP